MCGGLDGSAGWLRFDVPTDHPDFGKAYLCKCRSEIWEAHRRDRLIRFAGIPPDLRDANFDDFKTWHDALQRPLAAAQLFARGHAPFRWLFLHGSSGWGKSHLAAAILNARIEHKEWGPPGLWVSVPDMMRRLRSSYKDDSYEQTLTAWQEVECLVLDDLGAEYRRGGTDPGSGWAAEQLYLVLAHRQNYQLETVITTNEPIAQIGERLADRLMADRVGRSKQIGLNIPSYRSGAKW